MRPNYTRHARTRMLERGITEADVETVLSDYDTRHTDPDGNPVYASAIGNRRLRVVAKKDTNPPRIITVIWLN